ncbi:unnamed protein product [marine sediment metagenome]|uniref:Uncharacterized protein n=1 Tax=marine sediment metagenome TaxID=412755 RepID=X1SJB8_9ZZZZ
MPLDLQNYINDTNTQLKAIGDVYFDGIYDSMLSLHDWLDAEGNPNSADVILSMRWYVGKLRDKYSTASGSYRVRLITTLQWINDNWPEDGDGVIDMSMILNAMWGCEKHQPLLFIPMIDAMRGSIQNKTVTTDWMSQALKHFM